LVTAKEIVLIGHATGKSSAVEALVEYLKHHRPDVLRNVVATETADLSALTAPGIEAIAKHHMIELGG
jgi:predicted AAA+ superfamily ATPase